MTVTFKGEAKQLAGRELQTGERAPDFNLTGEGLKNVTLGDVTGHGSKNALLIVVPSLDTGVCSMESAKFNARISELPEDTKAYVVSVDLPFAQGRWAKDQGDMNLQMLSDYKDHSFGRAYGVRMDDLGLLARSIFLIGKDGRIAYKQIVPEVTTEPDYDAVFAAALKNSSAVNA